MHIFGHRSNRLGLDHLKKKVVALSKSACCH